mgnify:CR=1
MVANDGGLSEEMLVSVLGMWGIVSENGQSGLGNGELVGWEVGYCVRKLG